MNHCDEMTALLYLDGQLDDGRADEVRSHTAACTECRERLRALEMESIWLCESLRAESPGDSLPERLLHPPRRRMAPWSWVPVLGLSASGAYAVWSGFIVPGTGLAETAGFTPGSLLTMLFFSGAFWKGWGAMQEMTEFLAMATLGLLAIGLLRGRLRLPRAGAVLGMVGLALAFAASAKAAEVEHRRPSYTLPAGQEIKTDLVVLAGTTRIDGDVDGDLIVWSRYVTVNGHVKGDILAWGEDLHVNGPVDGNVRAAFGSMTLNSTVGKNLMAVARDVDLEDKASVGGTVTLAAGNLELAGRVGGDVLAFTGDTEIAGSLSRNAEIHARSLRIGPRAEIGGETKYVGRQQAQVSPSAKLGSPLETTIRKNPSRIGRFAPPSYWRRIWRWVLKWGASFVFGMVLLLLLPGFFLDVSRACRRIMPALGFGVLFLFATPIAAVIVCITIVGLGVGLSVLLLWGMAIYAAHIFVGAWVGERVLRAGTGAGLAGLAVGLLILQVVELLPYLGGWISFVVILWGIGALVLALYRRMQPAIAQ